MRDFICYDDPQERNEDQEAIEDGDAGRSRKMRRRSPEEVLKKLTAVESRMQELMGIASQKMDVDKMDSDCCITVWHRRKLSRELEKASVSLMMDVCKVLPKITESEERRQMTIDEITDATAKQLWSTVFPSTSPQSEAQEDDPAGDASMSPDKKSEEGVVEKEVDKTTTEIEAPSNAESSDQKRTSDGVSEEPIVEESDACEGTPVDKGETQSPRFVDNGEETCFPEDKETAPSIGEIAEEPDEEKHLEESTMEEAKGKDTGTCVVEDIKHSESGSRDYGEAGDITKASLCESAPVREPVNGNGEMKEATAKETVLQSADT